MSIRKRFYLAALLVAVVFASSARAEDEAPQAAVRATLEAKNRQFFYAGEPLPLRISIGNEGAETVSNPVRSPLLRSFEARGADGSLLKATGSAGASEPTRPEKLSPGSGYFAVVDLTQIFPELLKPGTYSVRWSADGLSTDTLTFRMIPRYDPTKEYRARVETDEGSFTLDFFAKTAPVAVKAFVDMANAGFYDGLTFHKVVPDLYVEGGDSAGDGSGPGPFSYFAELSSVPVVAGTVLMKPASPSPPTNGSQFIVVLRPEASWTGQATVLGQVVDGLDTVRKISRLPSSQQASRPFYKPLKDVYIRRVVVFEKASPAGG